MVFVPMARESETPWERRGGERRNQGPWACPHGLGEPVPGTTGEPVQNVVTAGPQHLTE